MSFITQHSHGKGHWPAISFEVLQEWLVSLYSSAAGAVRVSQEFERLNNLPDQQLNALGISRESLPRYLVSKYLS